MATVGRLLMGKFPAIAHPEMAKKISAGARWMEMLLRDLGIWDAEVLEGRLEPRDWQNDGRAHNVAIFTTDPAPADLCERAEAADRVRVIVLEGE